MWLFWIQSSCSHVSCSFKVTYSPNYFPPFRIFTDIDPLVINLCVILITELIFLIYVLRWQGDNSLALPLLYFISPFFGSPFPFLIFQSFRCSGSLKHPWGLQVLAFVSHFLQKQFFFNPMRLFTVVVLALSSLSLFLLLFFPSIFPSFSQLSLCQPEVNATLFSSACKKAGGIFLVIVT